MDIRAGSPPHQPPHQLSHQPAQRTLGRGRRSSPIHDTIAAVLPRLRWWVSRRPAMVWATVALLAGWCALVVSAEHRAARDERDRWGTPATVWVARHTIERGQSIVAEARSYPSQVVPAAAVTQSPAGAVAVDVIAAGQIVTTFDVTDAGLAGLIPAGHVAVDIPVALGDNGWAAGNRVQLFAEGLLLGTGEIVAVDAQHVTVAVPDDAAAAVAHAVHDNLVTLALSATPRR